MGSECTCGQRFLDAEDYRDHLPCEGTKEQREIARLRAVLESARRRMLHACEAWELANERRHEGMRLEIQRIDAALSTKEPI